MQRDLLKCECGECEIDSSRYKPSWEVKTTNQRKRKAGVFIYDPETSRIVLVQSRGNLWGCPKGSLKDSETFKNGAVREVKEETGLAINPQSLEIHHSINSSIKYFYFEMKYKEVKVQKLPGNDANAVGWFNIKCLENLLKTRKMRLTLHTRNLLRRFLNFSID